MQAPRFAGVHAEYSGRRKDVRTQVCWLRRGHELAARPMSAFEQQWHLMIRRIWARNFRFFGLGAEWADDVRAFKDRELPKIPT